MPTRAKTERDDYEMGLLLIAAEATRRVHRTYKVRKLNRAELERFKRLESILQTFEVIHVL